MCHKIKECCVPSGLVEECSHIHVGQGKAVLIALYIGITKYYKIELCVCLCLHTSTLHIYTAGSNLCIILTAQWNEGKTLREVFTMDSACSAQRRTLTVGFCNFIARLRVT